MTTNRHLASVYDNLGQLAAAVNSLADRTSFTYDAAGQQTATEVR